MKAQEFVSIERKIKSRYGEDIQVEFEGDSFDTICVSITGVSIPEEQVREAIYSPNPVFKIEEVESGIFEDDPQYTYITLYIY